MRSRAKDQKLADNARLLRAWKNWNREQLEEALAGAHGTIIERLMIELKDLGPAQNLLAFIEAQNWACVDAKTRLVALHEINDAIMRLRERNGLAPIDDALEHERPNAFLLIKSILFPR